MDNDMTLELAKQGKDRDYINAYQYLQGKLAGKTMPEIADDIGCGKSTLYDWVRKWEDMGLLIRIRQELLLPQVEDIRQAVSQVMRDWPKVIASVQDVALHSKSDHVRIEAAEWLYMRIVKPTLDEKPEGSVKELNYVNSEQGFDPTSIPDAAIQIVVESLTLPKIIEGKTRK